MYGSDQTWECNLPLKRNFTENPLTFALMLKLGGQGPVNCSSPPIRSPPAPATWRPNPRRTATNGGPAPVARDDDLTPRWCPASPGGGNADRTRWRRRRAGPHVAVAVAATYAAPRPVLCDRNSATRRPDAAPRPCCLLNLLSA